MDIGHFITRDTSNMSENEIFGVLSDCWNPTRHYAFPKLSAGKQTRSFQHHYLDNWPWLVYSEMNGGGAFCKFCVLFSKDGTGKGGHQSLGALVKYPMKKFKHATEIFKAHASSKYHMDSVVDAEHFIQWYGNKSAKDIKFQLDEGHKKQAIKNRQRY